MPSFHDKKKQQAVLTRFLIIIIDTTKASILYICVLSARGACHGVACMIDIFFLTVYY